ncbi:MAG: PD-(D/E)XK nuclease family protein [Candidatus Syntropharchaeia archaeon]
MEQEGVIAPTSFSDDGSSGFRETIAGRPSPTISDLLRGYNAGKWGITKGPILSVRAYTTFHLCPRKFYITFVKGLQENITPGMIIGGLKHRIFITEYYETLRRALSSGDELQLSAVPRLLKLRIAEVVYEEGKLKFFDVDVKGLIDECYKQLMAKWVQDRLKIETILSEGKPDKLTELLPISTEYFFTIPSIRLRGRVDMLFRKGDTIVPVEVKTSTGDRIWDVEKLQAALYSIAIENIYKAKCDFVKMYKTETNSYFPIFIGEEMREKAKYVIKKCAEVYDHRTLPRRQNSNLCRKCSHLSICETLG